MFLTFFQDWLQEGAEDKGKGRADGHRLNSKAVAAAEAAKRDAELRAKFVVVPAGDEAKAISCPICKETLKSEFMEDDEEWVWRNAVKRDDRVRATVVTFSVREKSDSADIWVLSDIPRDMPRGGVKVEVEPRVASED